MTNTARGVVSREINGETINFRIATNEWCELEDEFGKTTDEILKDFFAGVQQGSLTMKNLRKFFRAALSSSRPGLTEKEAGEVMSDLGLADAGVLLGEVILASMPQAEEGKPAPGKPARSARRR